jgi:5-methylcytosine-specific restriction endonuclease McrA
MPRVEKMKDPRYEEFAASLPGDLSVVKDLMLSRLWGGGLPPSGKWILSEVLLKETGQKYFDRRLRELRDELGVDIETGYVGGKAAWRLRSLRLNPPNPRKYLTTSQKWRLLESSDFACQVCGVSVEASSPSIGKLLQADHKVPLNRRGGHNPSNWQTLCVACNVSKRRACQDCEEACKECAWAFPEGATMSLLLPLTQDEWEFLRKKGISDGPAARDALLRHLGE